MARQFNRERKPKEKPEYDHKLLGVDRVTRVVAGGRRFRFRAVVVIGDRKGKVGVGSAKGQDVSLAVNKAISQAKKRMIKITNAEGTLPYSIEAKYGSVKVLLKPAAVGRGLVAGGAVRAICELGGIENISAKIISRSKNKLNIAKATLKALSKLKSKN